MKLCQLSRPRSHEQNGEGIIIREKEKGRKIDDDGVGFSGFRFSGGAST